MTVIGIMGGTFDPIHFGHLRAAEEVLQGFALERVVFVPSGRPPHKPIQEVTSAAHRFAMTSLALSTNPSFEVSRFEIDRQEVSYTLDTLRHFRERYGEGAKIYFITGLDAVLETPTWKSYRELFSLAEFIAVTRPGYDVSSLDTLEKTLGEELFSRIHLFPATLMAISSREIRRLLREGRSAKYLVPDAVLSYAEKERVYVSE